MSKKKITILLLLFIILLNVLFTIFLRHSYSYHEVGVDGFSNHIVINSLIDKGYIAWYYNPFSYMGLTEPSQPSGMYFTIGELFLISDSNPEICIPTFDMVLLILTSSLIFLLGLKIKNNRYFAFNWALLYTTSASFFLYAFSQISIRVLFLTIFPLLLLVLLGFKKSKKHQFTKKYLLLCFIIFTLLVSHRLYILLIPFLIVYMFFLVWNKIYFIRNFFKRKIKHYKIIFISLYFLLISLMFYIQFLNISIYSESNVWYYYESGAFFQGDTDLIKILNMTTNYVGTIGLIIFFIPLGIYGILKRHYKYKTDYILLFVFIIYTPLLALGTYVSLLLSIFMIYMGLEGLYVIIDLLNKYVSKKNIRILRNKSITLVCISVILFSCVTFNFYMENHRLNLDADATKNKNWISENNYEAGLYMRYQDDGKIIGNSIVADRVCAVSEQEIFQRNRKILVCNGDINISNLVLNEEVTFNSDYLFVSDKPPSEALHFSINYVGASPDNALFIERAKKYGITYVVVDMKNENGILTWKLEPIEVRFYKVLNEKRYCTYANNEVKIYSL